jgi:small subunit ribosomal protein S13
MVFNGVTKNLAYLSTQYENLIRILGNDIPGEKKILVGLTQIRGVGIMFANAIISHLKIEPNSNIGHLNVDQVESIEKVIQNPESFNFPIWFLNRRKDPDTGKDMHLVTSDIALNVRNDVEREKSVFSWRGYRHMFGLKVRGQRTRCTGRKGGAVGVAKGGRILPAKGGAGAPAAAAVAEGATAPAAEGATAPAAEGATAPAAAKKEAPAAAKKE